MRPELCPGVKEQVSRPEDVPNSELRPIKSGLPVILWFGAQCKCNYT